MKKINMNVHQKNSILYVVIYGGIILIILLVGILPFYFKISNQVKENSQLKFQIKEQKELAPVYQTLINANDQKQALSLPNPEKTALPRAESGRFHTDFQAAARKSGLKVVAFSPDTNTSAAPSTSFLHSVVLKGEWADFRKMIIEMGAIPYIDRIEEVNLQQSTGAMEFKLKVWIAIK